MTRKIKTRILALFICIALLLASLPVTAYAEDTSNVLSMIEGDVIADFIPAGTPCRSTDPSIAWVDKNGTLNALKPGTVTLSAIVEESVEEYTLTVEDYEDGSDIVGNLKILARYNDNMQFYDGHVYLLFTSYQDGVEITVPDLYAMYEISDDYYEDIRENIANGSNHTGSDTDRYFSYTTDENSVTLNRGEIVTIGMYRGFDLSVPQAALGSIQNSTAWNTMNVTAKTQIINILFKFLNTGELSTDQAIAEIKAVLDEVGADYNLALDGVVEGGVCFNRELYNQKLEWDQYENVTYEMDITRNQLNTMAMYLGGNLNKFSILKNSCATVALRAWNAAVGTRNGQPGAYYLSAAGEGVFSVVDAPKSVRDSIEYRLPGYFLNNSEDVAEPDAGYQDDTGWVYVSAPENVTPLSCIYENDPIRIDTDNTKISDLIKAANGGQSILYNKDAQEVGVNIKSDVQGDFTTISGIDFSVNGTKVTLDNENMPEDGCWFTLPAAEPAEDKYYHVFDADGEVLWSDYSDGLLRVCAHSFPLTFSYSEESIPEDETCLSISIFGVDDTDIVTEVYRRDGDEVIPIEDGEYLDAGTKVFIRSMIPADDDTHVLRILDFNYETVLDEAHYDADENAYFVIIPEGYSSLTLFYSEAEMTAKGNHFLQLAVGETLDIHDLVTLEADSFDCDQIKCNLLGNDDGVLELDGAELKAVKAGSALIGVYAESNVNIGMMFMVEVYENAEDMAKITFNDAAKEGAVITASCGEENGVVLYSGYMVKKGSVLTVTPAPKNGKAVLCITANGKSLNLGETVTVTDDTEINVRFADAVIDGMPEEIKLAAQGDTYQLDAKVKYTGLYQLLPVFDGSITYESSDEDLVTVDENGLITVTGDVPEDGKVVFVTAYAGSTNHAVSATAKVYAGDYKGSRIVGRLTISARPISKTELIAHGALTLTTYEDLEMPVSFYEYYQPNEKYNALMTDYRDHPENYTSDPALYNDNELNLEDRGSYFTIYSNGAGSDPQTISLKAGESITVSNYGFDSTNLTTIFKALENSDLSYNPQAQVLISQMNSYLNGEDYDGAVAFDSLLSSLMYMYSYTRMTGQNPANGHTEGGLCINRELYNQFRRSDSQMPNNYYTIEITADELELIKAYLADPENNYYSIFTMNCSTGAINIWNTALTDHPELWLTGNFTGFASDPQSLNIELGLMRVKQAVNCLPGIGGKDFYPRTVAYSDALKDTEDRIDAIGEVDASDECKARIDEAREAYDALSEYEKAFVRNIDDLLAAEEEYARLTAISDQEAFDAYKQEKLSEVDALSKDDDGIGAKLMIALAKAAINAQDYDDAMSLEENKALTDAIVSLLKESLDRLRKPESDKVIIRGDADGDGEVTIFDASAIQRWLAGIEDSAINEIAADADGDGEVTIFDASAIQRWLADIPDYEGIGEPIDPVTPDHPTTDVSQMKTLAEVYAAYPDIPFAGDSEALKSAVDTGDHIYLITATMTEDAFNAMLELEFDDPQREQKMTEILKKATIVSCEDIKSQVLSQEELDKLVGKTGQEILDLGYEANGYGSGEEGELIVSVTKGLFEYDILFKGEVDFDAEDFDGYEAFKTMTAANAGYSGINFEAF